MRPFTVLNHAIAAPLAMANVDTDQIIPKQFLSTVERKGLAAGLFYDFRFDESGAPKPDFVLNRDAYQGASVLIAGPNFGCGSSREHAPWALDDFGIRCVIASGFADIFYNNCFKNGILPLVLPQETVEKLMGQATGGNGRFDIDLINQTITTPEGQSISFDIDQGRKASLIAGLDEIGETLVHDGAILAFEAKRAENMPWLNQAQKRA